MNFYPHHIGDFNNDTRHLTRIERSIYRDLIELYYDTESPLIPDKDKLSRLVLASSKDELTAVEQVLNEFFDYTENGYFHSRCHEVICEYKKNIKGKSKAGIASAKARKARKLKALSELEDGQQVLNTRTTPVRNQKPETNNQKPITIEKRKSFSPPKPNEIYEHFLSKGLDVNQASTEASKFFNHYESNGWKVGKNKMSKWKNAATGWLNRRGEYEKNRPNTNEQDSIDWDSTDWGHGIIPQ
jgi:uncharacterized protein YdaU (DUF1376 family)